MTTKERLHELVESLDPEKLDDADMAVVKASLAQSMAQLKVKRRQK